MLDSIRSLWGRRWPLPLIPALYALAMFAIGDLRPEHVALAVLVAFLGYFGPRTKALLGEITPYLVVGLGYDLVRYARRPFVTADRVLGCELRTLELRTFSVAPGVTLQDWFQAHHSPFFDLLFAVPYTIFVYLVIAYAAYLYIKDRPRMRRYLLAFAIANYLSFVIWLVLPAAPPWYVRAHGCAIDIHALPSPAGLARVDELLGIHYYATFYGRAASVFGAMPSMHCAYPMLGLLTAWRSTTWKTRPLHLLYAVTMFVASNYLDHHWVWDGLMGWMTAFVAVVVAERVARNLERTPATEVDNVLAAP